ncbi:MAG: hypothetical protein EXR76_04210 [Myxococcales bacterium]|nr:hypothetical protein [Myxococcales bacterium]
MASVNAASSMTFGAQNAESGGSAPASLEKESFLKLLVAQISNQDPMSPQDSDQYMQQLTQFSTLEQLMNVNQGIEQIAVGQLSANSQSALRFVGKDIMAVGDQVALDGVNQPEVDFRASDPNVGTVTARVHNSAGEEVYSQTLTVGPGGQGKFVWSGDDATGVRQREGDYHVSFEAGTEEAPVAVDTYVRGQVTGVRFDKGYPELLVGDRRLKLSDVIEVLGSG